MDNNEYDDFVKKVDSLKKTTEGTKLYANNDYYFD